MVILHYLIAFFVVINLIVVVHEYGHYLAARKVGAKVVKFSLGMGPELCGCDDKNGTRWCISAFPVGGFVMMLGDGDVSSTTTDEELINQLSEEEKKQTITSKSNWEKIMVSFAGPFFNYVYAFVVLILLSCSCGLPKYDTTIGEVLKESAAEEAGLQKGDKILLVNNLKVEKFGEIARKIREIDAEKFNFLIERNGEKFLTEITPKIKEKKKLFGGVNRIKLLGIKQGNPIFEKKSFIESVSIAFDECVRMTKMMADSIAKIFYGQRSLDDFGSVVHMASVVGELSQSGNFALIIMFTITLSLNLGFINLLPLPVLDGGNIFFCLIEEISGRKINQTVQEYVMIFFAILLILLMLIMMANDIIRFDAVNDFITNLLR